jgi:hypothetical protein
MSCAICIRGRRRICIRREPLLGADLLHEVPAEGRVAPSAELFDRLASFGERLSARLFAAALEKSAIAAVPVASSDFVVTCENFRDAQPHLEQTRQRGRAVLLPLLEDGIVPVVTGFIGATPDGRITTLGRSLAQISPVPSSRASWTPNSSSDRRRRHHHPPILMNPPKRFSTN